MGVTGVGSAFEIIVAGCDQQAGYITSKAAMEGVYTVHGRETLVEFAEGLLIGGADELEKLVGSAAAASTLHALATILQSRSVPPPSAPDCEHHWSHLFARNLPHA